MWSSLDADIGLKEMAASVVGNLSLFDKVLTLDGNGAGGILVLDSELSVYESSAHVFHVWPDLDASLGAAEHLDHQLVVRDPWGDPDPVGEEEGVVVAGADVAEGDGVWLLSASAHAEDLVAVWVVVVVLVLSGVGHEEGQVLAVQEWVVAPVVDALEAVSLGVLEPAAGLVCSEPSLPVGVAFFGEVVDGATRVHSILVVEVVCCDDSEALIDGQLNIFVFFVHFTDGESVYRGIS